MTGGRPLGVLQPGDPEQIGAYLVRARIGAGGMGVVYLAEAPNGRSVALKVIQAALVNDSSFRERFRREVSAARRIRSRVTVAVLDADADARQPWVAFEYVEGPNLQQVVDVALPRLSATIGILTGIAEALVAIHQVGIIHRDLKPSNVLCPPDGVKVIDFGIAAIVEATTLSGTGFMGTPAWLAPEQVTGDTLTPAVDVFAWGCIALFTLTGRLAFGTGEDSPHAFIYRVVNVEPDLTGVPDELIDPVSAALSKRPEDRPAIGEILRMLLPSRWPSSGVLPAPPPTVHRPEPTLAEPVPTPGLTTPPLAPPLAAGPPPATAGPPWSPPAPEGVTAPAATPGWAVPAATPPGGPGGPPAPPGWAVPAAAPPGGLGGPPARPGGPPAPPGWSPGGPPTVPPPGTKRRRLVVTLAIVVAGVVLVAGVALAIGHSGGQSPVTTTIAPSTDTTTPVATTATTTATPAGLTPLAQLLPHDVDASADCSPNQSPPNLTGLTTGLICSPKNLPGGQIFAFQFDSPADYTASLAALNKFKGFDPASAGTSCPPGASAQNSIGWHSNSFPSHTGQILECLSVGTNNSQPDYIWTYPSDNVIIDAQAAEHSSFTDLDNWWTKDSPPP